MDSYLVCYGISDPKRLRRVARACEDYGYRKQYSVFLIRVSATDFVRLRSRLYELIDLNADQVWFVPLTDASLRCAEAIDRPTEDYDAHDVVIVL